MPAAALPTGTVTFVFTDIEGSTRLLQSVGAAYAHLLEEHRRLIRGAAEANGGVAFGSEGDALFMAFAGAGGALAAAVTAQRDLAAYPWPAGAEIRVRMGIHTGEATVVGDNYVGLDLHRAARITAAGHGGQVLLSDATTGLVAGALPAGVSLRDMGERRLKDLSRPERISQLVIEGLPSDFPPLRTLDAVLNNLPTQLTSFVGRDREVAEARRVLETTRLLTLTGPGGTGKTRLSLQVAAESTAAFPDGTFFVPLDAITDPVLVTSAIVAAIGAPDATRPPMERLIAHLRDRRVLLVLDNFEQVLAAAPAVAEILRGCRATSIIVSSRAALRISGEQEFPVPPLDLPGHLTPPIDLERLSHYESVALFIERAAAVRPEFAVTNENAPAVAEICARLDGLPLAIELAAARIKLLSPEAILARLGSRLGLLGGGARDLPERQQTLRGAIAWSVDLLEAPAQRLLSRAAIFVGSCRLDHAEAVCGPASELGLDVFDGLAALVDQSLVRQVETSGEPRFSMLQTIRDFSLEKLDASGERPAIARRHAHTFLALAREAAPYLLGPHQRRWLDDLEAEHDNFRAAIAWAIEMDDAATAAGLASVIWRFWQMRGYLREADGRMAAVLAMPGLAGRTALRRQVLEAAGGITYWMADLDRARAYYEEALSIARELGDPAEIAQALYNLSFVFSINKTDTGRARILVEESLLLFRALHDPGWLARALWALTNALYFDDDPESAWVPLEEAVPLFRQVGDQYGLAWALHTVGLIQLRRGRLEDARVAWAEMLRIFSAAEDVSGVSTALSNFRALAVEQGDAIRALRLGGASAALVQRTGSDLTTMIEEVEGRIDRMGGLAVDRTTAAAAWAAGQAMTTDEAVADALGARETPHP